MANTLTHSTANIELSSLQNRVEELERQQTLLVEAASILLVSRASSEVLQTIIELGRKFVAADAYAVWRKSSDGKVWALCSASGLSEQFIKEGSLSSAQEVPSTPMLFEDIEREPLLANRRPSLRAEGIRSMLAVPLRILGDISGTIFWNSGGGVAANSRNP
jgi:GAF domain-containing protein